MLINRDGLVFVARRIDTPATPGSCRRAGSTARRSRARPCCANSPRRSAPTRPRSSPSRSDGIVTTCPRTLVGRVWGGKYRGQKQRWFALRFTGTDADIDLAADGHPEFDDWRWVPIETLPASRSPSSARCTRTSSRSFAISRLPGTRCSAVPRAAISLPANTARRGAIADGQNRPAKVALDHRRGAPHRRGDRPRSGPPGLGGGGALSQLGGGGGGGGRRHPRPAAGGRPRSPPI